MSRKPREISKSGIYHIIFRGISRQNIFEEERDFYKLLEIIAAVKNEIEFEVYAYCLMSNHVHMAIKEKEARDISRIMLKILTAYAVWFNRKYERIGVLIGNRYKSKPVEDERYLMSLIRYIHQNPLRAGIVSKIWRYRWSSYNAYLDKGSKPITDKEFILQMLSENPKEALKLFKDFHSEMEDETFEISDSRKKSEEYIRKIIMKTINNNEPGLLAAMEKEERNRIIRLLREKERLSIREIERATGISRGIIAKAK